VELFEAGQEYRARYDGFAQHDVIADLWERGDCSVSYVDKAALGIVTAGSLANWVPTGMVVQAGSRSGREGLNCFICRPFLDTSQAIHSGFFVFPAGSWAEIRELGIQNEVKLYQYDGSPNLSSGAESRFDLPTNPVFCVSLYRGEPTDEHDWAAHPAGTEVHFGVGTEEEWALVLPYGGAAYLQHRVGGQWWKVPHAERNLRLPSLAGMQSGQRVFLWIAVLGGRIVVSTDGFAEDVWGYEVPGRAITVKRGKVALWHCSGQWAFSFFPIKMATAELESLPVAAGYDTHDSAGAAILTWRNNDVVDDDGVVLATPVVSDVTEEKVGLPSDVRVWRAELQPYEHTQTDAGIDPDTGEPIPLTTHLSPELYAVQIGEYADVRVAEAPESTDITDDVKEIIGESAADLHTSEYALSLDNHLGRYADLRDYRRVKIELGWRYDDETNDRAPIFAGHVVEPKPEVGPGGESGLIVPLLDAMIRLRDEKCDGRAPVFDGWTTRQVFQWVLDRCGVPRVRQDLEDTGVRLSMGPAERPMWQVEHGRPWVDFLAEVARYDYNAGFFFDETETFIKACRYCRRKRTADDVAQHSGWNAPACPRTPDWELYTRGEEAPEPDAAGEIVSIEKPRLTLPGRDTFANYVAVAGVDSAGRRVRGIIYDPASVGDPASESFVGWRKMHVEAMDYYTTQAVANQVAAERFAELAHKPEYVGIVTPMRPQMKVGHVVHVNGGEDVGANDQLYRIVAVRHRLTRRPRVAASTEILARWIG
jgi:hypothetical protein